MSPSSPPSHAREQWSPLFRELLGHRYTVIGGLSLMLVAALPGLINTNAGLALLGAAIAALVVAVVVAVISQRRAEQNFFAGYAVHSGMSLAGKTPLPPRTPMLRKGDRRYAQRLLTGSLAEGVNGQLALFTYEVDTTDSKGNKQTNYHHFTLGLVEIPELRPRVGQLLCQRRSGLRMFEKLEDVFRSAERLTLESKALHDKYEIFAGKGQDPVWLRRLFSPTFIVWLTESAPNGIAFELDDGLLCLDFKGHKKSRDELDQARQVTAFIARRIREEI